MNALVVLTVILTALGPQVPTADPGLYRLPPPEIAALVGQPGVPAVEVGPRDDVVLLLERGSRGESVRPDTVITLGGYALNPRNQEGRLLEQYNGLRFIDVRTGRSRSVAGIPDEAVLQEVRWSPGGTHVAFVVVETRALRLWVANVVEARARPLAEVRLNGLVPDSELFNFGDRRPGSYHWMPDGKRLVARTAEPGAAAGEERGAIAPRIRETSGSPRESTVAGSDPLSGSEAALFERLLRSRVVLLDLDGGMRALGAAGLITRAEPSPAGDYLLIERMQRPFSFPGRADDFPIRKEVWDLDGVLVREIADLPLNDGRGVRTGPTRVNWRPDDSASLVWAEAVTGDPEARDRVYMLPAPFTDKPTLLTVLPDRMTGMSWGGGAALIHTWWFPDRVTRTWEIDLHHPDSPVRLLTERSMLDRYGHPGVPARRRTAAGTRILQRDHDGWILLLGDGAAPDGARPFVDRWDPRTGRTDRVWQNSGPSYERPIGFLDQKADLLLTRREAPDDPPDYHVRDLASGRTWPLTRTDHPAPSFRGMRSRILRYQRKDGVSLTGTLFLPAGYEEGDGPLPTFVWAYPREYRSASDAGQVSDSPYRYRRIDPLRDPHFMIARGWAVLDDPTIAIVGAGSAAPTDDFPNQLVLSAEAAVQELVRLGVSHPERIAVGGHSYGGMMVAHLLARTDLFAAGIARSGFYNTTLTPAGIRQDPRTLWEARDLYLEMSAIMVADRINEPLLLIHGAEDGNQWAFTDQSIYFYQALEALGAEARLVLLPEEGHVYARPESILHMLWEQVTWLERHVGEPVDLH